MEENIELKENNIYLTHRSGNNHQNEINSFKLLLITDTSYQLMWLESENIMWFRKDNFIETHTILENITNFIEMKLQQ